METKFCRLCMEEQPIENFHVGKRTYKSRRKVEYLRNECKPCYTDWQKVLRIKSRIKVRLKKDLKEANYRAAVRLLKENPHWLEELATRSPLMFQTFLKEEQEKVVEDALMRSLKFGYRAKERNTTDILEAYHGALDALGMSHVKPMFNKRLAEKALNR